MKCLRCKKELGVPLFREIRIDTLFKQYICQHCNNYQEYTTTDVTQINNYKVFNWYRTSN